MDTRDVNGILGIVSPIVFVFSFVADVIGILESIKIVFQVLMLISAFIMLGCAIYFWKQRKKYAELVEKSSLTENELQEKEEILSSERARLQQLTQEKEEEQNKRKILELLVCDGKQYLSNKATIKFDLNNKKYKLYFEKRYIIISDAIKWYEGQFYSNKYLDSAEKSQSYYQDNPVEWSTLNIAAELRFKNVNDKNFSNTKQLAILQIAEGNNYKKFHIQYNTKKGDRLPIKKGAEIILNYSYEVPVSLWGSYLNRYISYWCEAAEVVLCCNDRTKLVDENIKIYKADHTTGVPYILEIENINIDTKNGETSYSIKLPNETSGKYSVWWNAENIFEMPDINTDMTVDHSQQTQY